jgi:hypothetical protein
MAEGGYDTANYVNVVATAAKSKYGTPDYWLRYFSPSPNGTVNNGATHAKNECNGVWDSGARNLSPITSPSQSRLGGTSAQGLADAQAFVSALRSVYGWVAPLLLPSGGVLRCWLDQESSTSMSVAYWAGWSDYINGYEWNPGYAPLFACLYCNPCAGAGHNCTTIVADGYCWTIWSSEPESPYCSYKVSNLPPWHATTCSCVSNGPGTTLWQFAEEGVCGLTVNIDMDEGTLTPYSFHLAYDPIP